jgi:hypothetical protein
MKKEMIEWYPEEEDKRAGEDWKGCLPDEEDERLRSLECRSI